MTAPSLRIPVALDLDSLKQQTDKASSHVGSALRLVSSQFAKLNGETVAGSAAASAAVGAGWVGSAARIVTAVGVTRLAVGGAALAMGAAIREALKQLEEMIEVSTKASASGVSVEFFQGFVSEARKAKVTVQELEGAIKHAFETLKPTADLSKPFNDLDQGLTGVPKKITDVETLLKELFLELFDKSRGSPRFLDEFTAAGTSVEKQTRAVLTAMIELENEGQKLASLALGEKVFGPEVVNRMREGKTSAFEIRQSLDRPPANIFSQEQTDRAKEIDRQLKIAHATLTENLRPAWEGLANVTLTIESTWTRIVQLLAKAASVTSVFSQSSANRQDQADLADINNRLTNNQGAFGQGLTDAGRKQLEKRRDALIKQLLSGFDAYEGGNATNAEGGDIPLPRRRPDNAPKAVQPTAATRDRFEASADSIEKRTAALEAENKNINLGTEAREKAKIAAELETVAKQLNTAAGIKNGEITEEQRTRIDAVAAAYGRAALAIEQSHAPLETFARESANLSKQLNQFGASSLENLTGELANVVSGTKSVADAFKSMSASIVNDLLKIAIRQQITGPLAGFLGLGSGAGLTFSGDGSQSSMGGGFGGAAFGGKRAEGGPVSAGKTYLVGERGPEIILPSAPGTVIPNHVLGGQSFAQTNTFHIEVNGSAGSAAENGDLVQKLSAALHDKVNAMVGTGIRQQLRPGGLLSR